MQSALKHRASGKGRQFAFETTLLVTRSQLSQGLTAKLTKLERFEFRQFEWFYSRDLQILLSTRYQPDYLELE